MTVSCPKCKGGCDLCGGSGRVPEGVARVYVREETRQTTKMSARQIGELTEPWPNEATTTPATVARAEKIRRIVFWSALVTAGVIAGLLLFFLLHAL